MTISEQSRHDLHTKLENVLGADAAATLMEHLPPTTWADVATKHDLTLLRRDLDLLEQRINANVRAEINAAVTSQTRTVIFAVIGSNLTMAALAIVR